MSSKGKKRQERDCKTNSRAIDADAVRELAELLKETGLTEIEIEHKGARIRVSRSGGLAAGVAAAAPAPRAPAAARARLRHRVRRPARCPRPWSARSSSRPNPANRLSSVSARQVKEGDTLFIVEAMKTMNAITAPGRRSMSADGGIRPDSASRLMDRTYSAIRRLPGNSAETRGAMLVAIAGLARG